MKKGDGEKFFLCVSSFHLRHCVEILERILTSRKGRNCDVPSQSHSFQVYQHALQKQYLFYCRRTWREVEHCASGLLWFVAWLGHHAWHSRRLCHLSVRLILSCILIDAWQWISMRKLWNDVDVRPCKTIIVLPRSGWSSAVSRGCSVVWAKQVEVLFKKTVLRQDVLLRQIYQQGACGPVLVVLQPPWWCCIDCMIHHERDVREEQKYMCVARTSNNWVISIMVCCHGAKLCAYAARGFRSQQ